MAGIGKEGRRSSSGTERNWGGLEAEGRRCLGENGGESEAIKRAWSRRGINAALRRIDHGIHGQQRQRRLGETGSRGEEEGGGGGVLWSVGKGGEQGPLVIHSVGFFRGEEKRFGRGGGLDGLELGQMVGLLVLFYFFLSNPFSFSISIS